MVQPTFTPENMRYAYALRYHLGFQTYRSKPLLRNSSCRSVLESELSLICERNAYHLLDSEVGANWVKLLLSLRPDHSPAKTAQTIKANLSRRLIECFPALYPSQERRAIWARGYFARSVGDMTSEVVLRYVQSQKDHHELLGNAVPLAEYNHPQPMEYFRLRARAHCMAEYNCHLVCTPIGRHAVLDERIAKKMISYLLEVGRARDFVVISLAILSNHMHLFAALPPSTSPEALALTVMNNTSYWLYRINPGLFRAFDMPGYWASSAYLGSAGAATTNQIHAYLRGAALR